MNKIVSLLFLLVLGFFPFAAFAEAPAEEEMSFSFYKLDLRPQFDLTQQIFASGTITPGTADKFNKFIKDNGVIAGGVVYFNSPGGSLVEGMALGEAIRAAGLNTNVGVRGLPQKNEKIDPETEKYMTEAFGDINPPEILSGICLSACSLAYLGGVHRYWKKDSVYGVHQFSSDAPIEDALGNAQIVSGVMVGYIKDKQVDPALFSITTQAGPDEIVVLSGEELTTLNIVTGSALEEKWELKSLPEGIYLVGMRKDERGVSKMLFSCSRKDKVLKSAALIPAPDEVAAQRMLSESIAAGYFVDANISHLKPKHGLVKTRNYDEAQAQWLVYPEDIAALVSAKRYIGFALLPDAEGMFYGLRIGLDENGRNLINNYARDCWQ